MTGSNPDSRENPSDVYVNRVLSLDSAGINAYFQALMLEKFQEKRPEFLKETRFFTGIGCGAVNALILAQSKVKTTSDVSDADAVGLCLDFWKNAVCWAPIPQPTPPSGMPGAPAGGEFNMSGPVRPLLEKYLKPWTLRTLRDDGVFVVMVAYEPNPQARGRIEPRIYSNLPENGGEEDLVLDKSLIDIAESAFSTPVAQLMDQWAAAAGTAPNNPVVLALSEARKMERFGKEDQERFLGGTFARVENRVLSVGSGQTDAAAWNDGGLNAPWGPSAGQGIGGGLASGIGELFTKAMGNLGGGMPGMGSGLFGGAGPGAGTGWCGTSPGSSGGWFGGGQGAGAEEPGSGADGGWPGNGLFGSGGGWSDNGLFGSGGNGLFGGFPASPFGCDMGASAQGESAAAPGETKSPLGTGFDVNGIAYQWLATLSKWSKCYTPPANSAPAMTEREAAGFLGKDYIRLNPSALEIAPYFATLGVSMNSNFLPTLLEGLSRDAEKEETGKAVELAVEALSARETA